METGNYQNLDTNFSCGKINLNVEVSREKSATFPWEGIAVSERRLPLFSGARIIAQFQSISCGTACPEVSKSRWRRFRGVRWIVRSVVRTAERCKLKNTYTYRAERNPLRLFRCFGGRPRNVAMPIASPRGRVFIVLTNAHRQTFI